VLDSLIPALLKDENRKFIYVEQVNSSDLQLSSIRCVVSWVVANCCVKLDDRKQCESTCGHSYNLCSLLPTQRTEVRLPTLYPNASWHTAVVQSGLSLIRWECFLLFFFLTCGYVRVRLQAFFQRWWRNQNDMIKDTVKGLISSGRLELMYVPSSFVAATL